MGLLSVKSSCCFLFISAFKFRKLMRLVISSALLFLFANLSEAQIKNADFESWDSTFAAPYTAELDTVFGVAGAIGGKLKSWISASQDAYGLSRSSDSQSGDFAMILHNWYSYVNESVRYRDTLSGRPQFLRGHFKYITGGLSGLSQGSAFLALTRLNGSIVDTIATGTYLFDSAAAYTPFQIELEYRSSSSPEFIDIRFTNSDRQCLQGNACHLLYLDNLSLAGTATGLKETSRLSNRLQIHPNPFSSRATLQADKNLNYASIVLYDSYGRRVLKSDGISGHTLTLERALLPAGFYTLLIVQKGNVLFSEKLLISE